MYGRVPHESGAGGTNGIVSVISAQETGRQSNAALSVINSRNIYRPPAIRIGYEWQEANLCPRPKRVSSCKTKGCSCCKKSDSKALKQRYEHVELQASSLFPAPHESG